jgi:polygalacturonase
MQFFGFFVKSNNANQRLESPVYLSVALFAVFLGFCATNSFAATYNVREYGAKGDGTNHDTAAIQAAVNACNQIGGGEVLVPAGNYLCGKIILKSNVMLDLENGATIWESWDILDYDKNPTKGEHGYLFVAAGQENIVICGDGKITGTGQGDLGRREDENKTKLPDHRFGIIDFKNCANVHLRNFQILDSEAHAVIFSECRDVYVDGVSVINNFLRINTDGIDPTSCTNVFISNCHIVAGDDCICPKTENGIPLENLVVENCILESIAGAVKLGTGSSGDFRDIKVSNCVIRNSGVGLGLFIKDGGTVERVSFSNISIETTRPDEPINSRLRNNIIPIYIDLTKRDPDSPISRVRDISFSNIQIASDNSIVIQGLPEQPIENLTLRDITFRENGAFDFSQRTKREGGNSTYRDENRMLYVRQPTWCALAHVNGCVIDNLRVSVDGDVSKEFPRSALAIFGSKDVTIKNVARITTGDKAGPPVIALDNCGQVLVTGCMVPPGTAAFLDLTGKNTRGICLMGNDLNDAARKVVQDANVPANAVKTDFN